MSPEMNIMLGGVGLIQGSIPGAGPVMVEIANEMNPYLVADGFLANAKFELCHGIIRFGTKCDPFAQIGPIRKRDNELQFAVEVEMAPLRRASKEVVKAAFLKALIPCLFAIAVKYDLPTNGLIAYSESMGFSISKEIESDDSA